MELKIDSSTKKGLTIGIITSIVGSFLFAFLEPLLRLLWNLLTTQTYSFYSSFVDKVYIAAAKDFANSLLPIIYLSVLTILICILVWSHFYFIRKTKETLNSYVTKKLNSNNKTKEDNELLEEISRNNRVRKPFNYNSFKKEILWVKSYNIILFVVLIIISFTTFFKASVSLDLRTTFNQRIDIISPYIEDIKVKKLKSQWASMKNKKDFEEINKSIEEIAITNNLVLP